MKAKEIQDLLDFIARSGLDEVNIETDQFKINVRRTSAVSPPAPRPPEAAAPAAPSLFVPAAPANPLAPSAPADAPLAVAKAPETALITIRSPMIGTFYRAASPQNPPLTAVGEDVAKGQPVCIIEAMKLFNEIESEVSGRIVKVLVENASPVEYDQPLFLVEP